MREIMIAALIFGGLGLLFGALLSLTGRVFALNENPQANAIREILPGANCGGCGYAGCEAYANAVAIEGASISACPVGGGAVAKEIAAIMGVEVTETQQRLVATVICRGGLNHCASKYEYHGVHDCVAAAMVADGPKACHYACLGLGTCAKACPFDAIHIDERQMLVEVDREKCEGCGSCIAVCPKNVLHMEPVTTPVRLLCHANEKGLMVTDNCVAGCFGCGRCVASCKFGAIELVNYLPVIDYTKCVGCMMCAESCPSRAMWADYDNRLEAKIDRDLCIGCTACKRACPFHAIIGERRQPHSVSNVCTGCTQCVAKCPKHAIRMVPRIVSRDDYTQMDAADAKVEQASLS